MRALRGKGRLIAALVMLMAGGAEAQEALPPLKDNQTILKFNGGGRIAKITVRVNEQTVPPGASDSIKWTDISARTRPGRNTVRVSWNQPTIAAVYVSHAATKGAFRRVGQYDVLMSEASKAKEKEFVFTLPGTAQTDVAGGRPPRPGSANRQVVIIGSAEKRATVYLNGKKAGDFASRLTLDVSNLAKPGENQLRVTWKEPQFVSVKVSYAREKDRFHDLTSINLGRGETEKLSGETTATFTLPE